MNYFLNEVRFFHREKVWKPVITGINLITGANNSGKTSLLNALYSSLLNSEVPKEYWFLLDLEQPQSKKLSIKSKSLDIILKEEFLGRYNLVKDERVYSRDFKNNKKIPDIHSKQCITHNLTWLDNYADINKTYQSHAENVGENTIKTNFQFVSQGFEKNIIEIFSEKDKFRQLYPLISSRIDNNTKDNSLFQESHSNEIYKLGESFRVFAFFHPPLLKEIKSAIYSILGFNSIELKKDKNLVVLSVNDIPLSDYGSGVVYVVSLLENIIFEAFKKKKILFIDEPELGLHPPTAYKLGEWLVSFSEKFKLQIFCTTHSPTFLQGIINTEKHITNIIHLNRGEDKTLVKLATSEVLKKQWALPLFRYSNTISFISFNRVVICEDVNDARIYNAMYDFLSKGDNAYIDVVDTLFVGVGGKGRIKSLVSPVLALKDISSLKIIYDIDAIFKPESSGLDSDIKDWDNIKKMISKLNTKKEIRRDVKKKGILFFEKEEMDKYIEVLETLKKNSIYICPFGELESLFSNPIRGKTKFVLDQLTCEKGEPKIFGEIKLKIFIEWVFSMGSLKEVFERNHF